MSDDRHIAVAVLESARKIAQRDERGNITATISIVDATLDFRHTTTTVSDVTENAANAMIETAKYTYAIPEQEKTKRAAEVTRRERQYTYRHALVCGVVVFCAVLVYLNPDAGIPMVGLVGVLGGVYSWTTYVSARSKALPPKSGEE